MNTRCGSCATPIAATCERPVRAGRKGGRPRKVDDADAAKARQLREKGITARDIAKMLGVSRATVYRYLADDASLAM